MGTIAGGIILVFFFAMDKAYGTKTMYKQFIDACHEAGMAVILDVVYNHATGNNPLAKLYWMVIRLQRIIHTSMWKHLILIACSMISIMKAHWCVSL